MIYVYIVNSLVHGILQARILERVSFSRGSSWPRAWTWVFCVAGRFFTVWATTEAPFHLLFIYCELFTTVSLVRVTLSSLLGFYSISSLFWLFSNYSVYFLPLPIFCHFLLHILRNVTHIPGFRPSIFFMFSIYCFSFLLVVSHGQQAQHHLHCPGHSQPCFPPNLRCPPQKNGSHCYSFFLS